MAAKPLQTRLKDVAKACGVHVVTVSSVLNDTGRAGTRVSKETAELIRQTAEKLNYRPNRYAQIIRNRRSGIIGMIQTGSSELTTHHSGLLARAIRRNGYGLLVNNLMWFEEDVEAAFDNMFDAHVEGIILSHPRSWISRKSLDRVQALKIPILAFNGVEMPGLPQIRHDPYSGLHTLASHLISRGKRRIFFLGARKPGTEPSAANGPHQERLRAAKDVIKQHGGAFVDGFQLSSRKKLPKFFIAPLYADREIYRGDMPEVGYDLCRALWKSHCEPDALLCAHDRYALGAIRACFHEGISVPKSISITGYGNESYGAFLGPSLTSLSFGSEADAQLTIDHLVKAIRGEQTLPGKVFANLPGELIVRESS